MPAVGAAAIAGGAAIYRAHKQSSAANNAAKLTTSAANHAADVQGKSAAEALTFQRQQAENDAKNTEATRRANYDQWAARERRLGSVGEALGYGTRNIPAYVPTIDPHYDTPMVPPTPQPRRPTSVAAYLMPSVQPAPGPQAPTDPYSLRNVGAYLR